MTATATVAEPTEKPAEAERPSAPKPEGKSEVEAKQEIKAAEPVVTPAPPSAPVIAAAGQEISTEEFHAVERHLADHIRSSLPQDMVQDMELTLLARPHTGKTDLVLALHGKMLEPNGALVTEKVMAMLKQHPEMQSLFARTDKPFELQPDGHARRLDIVIPKLDLSEYCTLIHGLKKHADEKMAGSNVLPIQPQEAKQDTKAAEHSPTTTVSNVQREETLGAAKGALRI